MRTLGRFEESRRLTRTAGRRPWKPTCSKGGGSAADRQRRQAADVAERVAALEKALPEGLAALRQEGQSVVAEQVKALGELERRLAALEAAGNGAVQANAGTPAGSPAPAKAPPVSRPRRVYPDLVTADAEPGEELVYGDAATAVIVQWREARDAFGAATDAMDILNARERRLELEVELIEKLRAHPAPRDAALGLGRPQAGGQSAERDAVRGERGPQDAPAAAVFHAGFVAESRTAGTRIGTDIRFVRLRCAFVVNDFGRQEGWKRAGLGVSLAHGFVNN